MKTVRKYFISLLFAGAATISWSQSDVPEDATSYNVEAYGSWASGLNTPFWFASNTYGVVPLDANNGYGRVGVFHQQHFGKGFRWGAGIDAVVSGPRYKNFYIQQAYANIGYKCLELTVGSKEQYESILDRYMSTGDVLQSANARPMPEVHLAIPEFTVIPLTKGWLQAKGNISVGRTLDNGYLEYFTGGNQTYIKSVLWHKKAIYLQLKDTRGSFPLSAIIGIQHVAQWGGTSTNSSIGDQPSSLKDFVRIFFGKEGGSDATTSDQINVLGNHAIAYDFSLAYTADAWQLRWYYQHMADDKSGIEFYNGTDGLWGLQLDLQKFPWIRTVILEYFTTMNQSGPFHYISFDHDEHPGRGGGADSYYNNGEYVQGLSYFNRGTGSPLIPSPEYNTDGKLGFKSNRVKDWHIGICGDLSSHVSYRIFCTVMRSYGTMGAPYLERKDGVSLLGEVQYTHPKLDGWKFGASIGSDTGDVFNESSTGFSLKVSKSGILKKWK